MCDEQVLGEPGAGHAGGAVHGRGGDMRSCCLHQVPGGHPLHLEQVGQRYGGDQSHQGHLQEGAQPPTRHSHRVQGPQRQHQVSAHPASQVTILKWSPIMRIRMC